MSLEQTPRKLEGRSKRPPLPSPRYLSVDWLAAYFGVSKHTIWKWTRDGRLPQPKKLSPGTTRWDAHEIPEVSQ